jgi:site-specific recombinase XerD
MITHFCSFLTNHNLSKNTIQSYSHTVEHFLGLFEEINKTNLLEYKNFLLDNYKPKTVNLRIQALNKYLEYLGKEDFKLKFIKFQQTNFLDRIISNADYEFLKNKLKQTMNYKWYFVVRFLGATGARVSELIQFKAEDVKLGYIDIYSKGGKIRRIYIPHSLAKETKVWLESIKKESGFLFTNIKGEQITTRGIAHQLKKLAKTFKINEDVVYPHSFRHRFAKNFLEKYNDLALLSDLMGHESIETTRIYLRRTSNEQQSIVDKVVTW